MSSVGATFIAALRSVGTAATMAMAGFYLHRKQFVTPENKKGLARISQQVTIPAFLFTKIVYCNQNFSDEPCPSITDNLADVWMLLLWPLYVVGMGILVGKAAAKWSRSPPWQTKSVLAACAFANSTGLPITLLTVVHANFPLSSTLGRVDPTIFLSVYLLLYPVLQWGIGGWLLAPAEQDESRDGVGDDFVEVTTNKNNGFRHVLNQPSVEDKGNGDADESDEEQNDKSPPQAEEKATKMIVELSMSNLKSMNYQASKLPDEETQLLSANALANPKYDLQPLTATLGKVMKRALQPPVVGALFGLFVSSIIPLRGLFVDMDDRDDDAVLEWFFDGLYAIGQAAVPINMFILGINLSSTAQAKSSSRSLCSPQTVLAIVIGKMVVMPIVGIATTWLLREYVFDIPQSIDSSFYLVLMIVCITPTANNVMVMVELSGSGAKEGMAQIIGWQYATAPILLSMSVMVVVRVASQTG